MELFIQIKDDQPYEHPIVGDNFRQAFPNVDTNNLPPEFARFKRIAAPTIGAYEVYDGATYDRDGEAFKDVHHVRLMTFEEITATQNAAKTSWAQHGFASWVFDEVSCSFNPPTPCPIDGQYNWDEATTSWVVWPEQPE